MNALYSVQLSKRALEGIEFFNLDGIYHVQPALRGDFNCVVSKKSLEKALFFYGNETNHVKTIIEGNASSFGLALALASSVPINAASMGNIPASNVLENNSKLGEKAAKIPVSIMDFGGIVIKSRNVLSVEHNASNSLFNGHKVTLKAKYINEFFQESTVNLNYSGNKEKIQKEMNKHIEILKSGMRTDYVELMNTNSINQYLEIICK
jgi:hypothetical protein